ncbi:MAG TPA: T9SS type A sorting domain-containing protein [Ignavibacteria bacterium]|nr:T9SS type A sorting domain-containing protein [Ignavibacteria bacterium]HRA99378.1 T9SS type A sorting domain-containing protein [Ignavibacteria bacterium]
MKKVIFSLVILVVLVFTSISYSQYGLSDAIITGTGAGKSVTFIDPHTNASRQVFAGQMNGSVDNNSTKFYCIDLRRTLSFPDECHKDSAVSSSKIVYVLNNYLPYNPDPVGELPNLNDEVASTQCAIWHFSDGMDANTITDNTIKVRTLEIIADADANGVITNIVTTFSIEPGIGIDEIYIKTLDQNGDPIAINNIQLSISEGSLSTNNVNTTLPNGESPAITVLGTGTGIITATAMCMIPQGVTYACPNKQRLVIAAPAIGEKEATFDWGALPVELSSFTSVINSRNVTLNWSTSSEINNSGFDIERKVSTNETWSKVGNVTGNGTTNETRSYSFTDKDLSAGQYSYRLKQVDFNGNFEYFNLSNEVVIAAPDEYSLNQNYPNPFNPSTKISFQIPVDGAVSLKIFDISGKEVLELVNGNLNAGFHTINFNATGLTSGVYFYKLSAGNFTKVMKMSLIK